MIQTYLPDLSVDNIPQYLRVKHIPVVNKIIRLLEESNETDNPFYKPFNEISLRIKSVICLGPVIESIMKELSLKDAWKLMLVSKKFKEVSFPGYIAKINNEMICLTRLNGLKTPESIHAFIKKNRLTNLNFGSTVISLSKYTYIQKLRIFSEEILDLSRFTNLQSLECCSFPNDLMVCSQSLKCLMLYASKLKDEDIAGLEKFTNLRKLTFEGGFHITSLNAIAKLNLQSLVLRYLSQVNVSEITGLKDLTNLNITGINIKLKGIGEFQNLVKLTLHAAKIGDNEITELKLLTQLQSLEIGYSKINDPIIGHLSQMSHLRSLCIKHCRNFTDQAIDDIIKLTGLYSLNLMACYQLNANCFIKLTKLTNLQRLELSAHHNFTSDIIIELCKMPNLEYLSAFYTHTVANIKAIREQFSHIEIRH